MSTDLPYNNLSAPPPDGDSDDLAQIESRVELVRRYNLAVGPPCDAISAVHADFIKGVMRPDEMLTFVRICKRLIAAAKARDTERRLNLERT